MQMILDVGAAAVSRSAGGVTFNDPNCPVIVTVRPSPTASRLHCSIERIEIVARPGATVTATKLGRLPLRQMLHVAKVDAHPDEMYYRMLAVPKPPGRSSWPDEHWSNVLAVANWARAIGRTGGGTKAVADMWGVARKPTAQRWITEARRRNPV